MIIPKHPFMRAITTFGISQVRQDGASDLIAPGRFRLIRILCGHRGTEAAMGNPTPAGARVVMLDSAIALLPIAEADFGLPWNWRIGPAARAVSDASYTALAFTPAGRGLPKFDTSGGDFELSNVRG